MRKKLRDRLLLRRHGQTQLPVSLRGGQFLGNLSPRLAIDSLPLSLAIHIPQVNRSHPSAVTLSPINRTFMMTSFAHRLFPSSARPISASANRADLRRRECSPT